MRKIVVDAPTYIATRTVSFDGVDLIIAECLEIMRLAREQRAEREADKLRTLRD